jgi:hypothetical protein
MLWGGSADNVIGAKSPTALKDIVQPLLEVLESSGIRVARRPGAAGNIAGYYSAGGLLAADFGDVQVIAHEVGHFIHRSLLAGQNSASQVATNPNAGLSGLPPVIQGQIRGLAYRGTPPGLELTEGFAEAFRMWLTVPEVLANTAPETSRWISNWVVTQPTNVRSAITSAQQRARDFRFQGDQLRMVVQAPPTFLQRATSLLRGGWAKTWRAVYEDSGILDEIKPGLSEFWQGIRGSSRGWTDAWYEGRPTDLYGNAVEGARNFRQVVEPIKASERTLFDEYLVALRTLALENKGTDTGKAPAEARRLVERLDTERPHFARVAHDLSQWWAGVNSVLAQASPTYAAQLARIQAADAALGVDFYAPLHRWLGTQSGRSWTRTSAQRRALAGVVSDRQEGSSLAVKSPLEAFVNEARVRFDQAVYRNLIEQIVTAFDATGGNKGPLVANINELQGDLAFGGAMPGVEDTNESLTLALLKPELKGEMIPVTVAHVNPATGKLRYRHLRVDRRIADVAARVDPTMLRQGMGFWSTLASRSLAFQRRGLSATQIQWNPGFQYATNLMLDLPTSYLASRYFRWYELHELLGYTARNILANALGTVKPWKSDWIKTYENLGLQGSAGLEGELRVGSTVRSGIGKAHTLRSMMQAAMAFLSIPQRAVQLANMQKAAKVYKIDINQPLSPEQASILRLAARTPTNYTAGGDVSRAMQVAVPFVRPFFEAQRQSVEAAKRNPLDFSIKLGVLTAAWTAMRYLLADDELEKKKTAADALRSITLPVPGSDEGVEFRIESTMAPFTMLPIMVIESMREQGQDPTDFIMASIGTLIPPTDVPLARLVGQMVANKSQPVMATISSGAQAPVVPNQLADREGLAQQTPSTAPLAVNIATVMDAALSGLPQSSPLRQNFASPIRWESAIRAMLGGNALTMAEGWGVIPGLHPNVEPEWADMLPGVVRRNGMTNWNNRDIRAIYDIDRAAQVKEATRDGLYLEKPSDRVMRERVRALAATLSGMRFLATYDAAGMTVKERRDIVRAAEKVARECLEEIRAGKPPTKYFEAQATYEARRKQYDINRGAFYR